MNAPDFLSLCAASHTGNPILERVRGKSAEVTLCVYRLVKTALVHALDNAAVRDAAVLCEAGLETFASETGTAPTLTFVEDSVFVCGQLMKASRGAYEAAAELGEMLRGVQVSELSFERGVTCDQLLAFVREFATAARQKGAREAIADRKLPGVFARKIDPRLSRRRAADGATPAQRALRLYSTALVVMRQFYEDLGAGVTVLPHQVKRVAHRFVALAADEDPTMLGMTTMAKSHRDEAGRAVQAAILSLAIARQITSDRVALSAVALAALMSEAGAVRTRRHVGDRFLTDAEEGRVLGAAAFACISTGGVNPQSALRAVVAVELSWDERRALVGEPWGGEVKPLLVSELIATARHLLELVAPRDATATPLSPVAAVDAVLSRHGGDPLVGRLLVRAIGVIPIGTVAELSDGSIGVVTAPSPVRPTAAVVRILLDPRGGEPPTPTSIDLGATGGVRILRTLDPSRVPVDWTRPFVDG
ncbi:MAG: hypothetical protein JNL38_02385 [Myxococcales bacterium]|nr:hypothetical protein [Myxococcales bacterium]